MATAFGTTIQAVSFAERLAAHKQPYEAIIRFLFDWRTQELTHSPVQQYDDGRGLTFEKFCEFNPDPEPRATIDDLRGWMQRDLSRWGTLERRVQPQMLIDVTEFLCRFFTSKNNYRIRARNPREIKTRDGDTPIRVIVKSPETPSPIDEIERVIVQDGFVLDIQPSGDVHVFNAKFEMDAGYLGCTSSSRTPRPGEDHTRGSDLADGPLTEDTWRRILADIVSYEMVALAKQKKPMGAAPPSGPRVASQS